LKTTSDPRALLQRQQQLLTLREQLKARYTQRLGSEEDVSLKRQEARKLLGATQADYFKALTNAARDTKNYIAVKEGKKDEFFGTSGLELEVDHVYPRIKIFLTPGFEKLSWDQQVSLFSYKPNLKLIPAKVNSVRGSMPYRELPRKS